MQQLDIFGRTKEEKSIEFLRENEPPEGYFLGFSGGKDSIVVEHIAKRSGVKFTVYYSSTGIDPPEIAKFIKRYHSDVIWLRPEISFYKGIMKYELPNKFKRWCCKELKEKPSKKIPLKHRIMGIRREESARRAKRGAIHFQPKLKVWVYKPIFDWLEWEIWEYIERYKLPYCSLYDEGFDRLGCIICPWLCNQNSRKLKMNKDKWPKMYAAFERFIKEKYWPKHKDHLWENDADEFLLNWYNGNLSPKINRDQKKFDF